MEARLEKIENSEAYISVKVNAEQLEDGLQKAYQKVVKEVSLPGFRRGRVPRQLLEARFGAEILYQDAIEYIVPGVYADALKELDLEPIGTPSIDVGEINSGEPFTFTARVPVKPEVILGDLEGLEVSVPVFTVTEQDVENQIGQMQKRYAFLVEKSADEPAEDGDTVYHDFEGSVDGVPFEGGKGENYPLELGTDTFIPGYEEQLVGVLPGEEKDVIVDFPVDYNAEELAGQKAVFKIKVNKIETRVSRELDDDFVQEISEYDTVDDMRNGIRDSLMEEMQERRRSALRQEVLQGALKRCEVPVAEAVIKDQAEAMIRQLEYRMASQGLDFKQYMQITGNDEDKMLESFYPEAENKVKCDFMMEKLVEEKGIEVTDEEINKHIEEVAENTGMSVQEATERVGEVIDGVIMQLKIDKVLDYLVENAVITEETEKTEEIKETTDADLAEAKTE